MTRLAEKSKPALTELQIQIRIIKAAKDAYPHECRLLHHIPNGANTNNIRGKLNQMSGIIAGIPDLFLPYPTSKYHGLYMEVKKDQKARVRKDQRHCLTELAKEGYFTCVARSPEEGIKIIDYYLTHAA